MKLFVLLLRGINVSGQKKLKMSDLAEAATSWGLADVKTYIQSGNMLFRSEKQIPSLEQLIENRMLQKFGMEVTAIVIEAETLAAIYSANPFSTFEASRPKSLYYVFLDRVPDEDLWQSLRQKTFENEDFELRGRTIYLDCRAGYGKARCNNNFFEKQLKLRATTRNLNTVRKLLELAGWP